MKGRAIFLDEMAQVVAEGYSPSERLKRRLELKGVTQGDYRIMCSHHPLMTGDG